MILLFEELKRCFAKEYNIKKLGEVKMIIGWQISRYTALSTINIDQSAFIRDLVIKERLTESKWNGILMKVGSAIDMSKVRDDEETDLQIYECLIGKLMYLVYSTRPNIVFAVR